MTNDKTTYLGQIESDRGHVRQVIPGVTFVEVPTLSDRMDKLAQEVAEQHRTINATLEAENRVLDMLVDRLAELEAKKGGKK